MQLILIPTRKPMLSKTNAEMKQNIKHWSFYVVTIRYEHKISDSCEMCVAVFVRILLLQFHSFELRTRVFVVNITFVNNAFAVWMNYAYPYVPPHNLAESMHICFAFVKLGYNWSMDY